MKEKGDEGAGEGNTPSQGIEACSICKNTINGWVIRWKMGINLSCSCPWCQSLGIPLQRALKTRSGWQEEAVGVKVSSPEVDALPSRILMSENLALGPHRSNHVLQRKLKQAAGGISDESPFAACFEPRRAPLASAKLTPTHPKSGPLELPFTFCAECNFLTSAPANKQIERVRH